jgi:uncharacterized small protein (TIGR04563 family)
MMISYSREVRVTIDKRKQSLYFPEAMLKEIQQEANRLERSLSWIVQRCVRAALPTLEKQPGTQEPQNPDGSR